GIIRLYEGYRPPKKREETLNICIQKTVFNSMHAGHARKFCDTRRRFAWFGNRRINKEYQDAYTLSEKPFHFQASEPVRKPSVIHDMIELLSIFIPRRIGQNE
ncbi:MAG: hypothetical protein L7F78_26340, partial [Syntrophales bacterium LBB04]|nr:hypothetical protein [Syntrophales bacterium LBB04]